MQQHFRKIDFLRGIAILTVFQAHFIWYYHPAYAGLPVIDSGHPAGKWILLNFLPRSIGWGGVTIFILVSGFLLHLGYLKDSAGFTLRGFYSRRFWRVYPPYLLVLLAFSLLLEQGMFSTREGWIAFLFHCFSIQNLFTGTYFSVNPTFWCLALEVQLYLFYALLLFGRRRWGIKTMLGLSFGISILWQAIGARVGVLADSLPWTNAVVSLWVIWVAGAFMAEAWSGGRRVWVMFNRRDRLVALLAIVLACFLAPLNALLQYVAGLTGLFLMDAFLHAERITLRTRAARLVVAIGLCSFSVFLVHQPLLRPLIDFLDRHSPRYRGYRWVDGLCVSLFIFGLSWVMYRFVELPSIRFGARLRKSRKPATY